ncbi:IS3 family transposase [Collinsella sp. HCP3S3_D1]|uniref:IS3 family transposase n=1 Tax=Collinsella sp. HCP3S3_D1 TaxID=3438934 RepID=UPI003F89A749
MTHPDARRPASPSADPAARQAAYVDHWDTRRRRVKLKGLTPEEFRSQSFAA